MNKNGYFQSDKDGNVTKAPPKKQPPPFDGGVTSWNDLPDRPFGESVETVVLPEMTQVSAQVAGSGGIYFKGALRRQPVVGAYYSFVLDGTKYPQMQLSEDYTLVIEQDKLEIAFVDTDVIVFTHDWDVEHTIEIYEVSTSTIPIEYIKDMYGITYEQGELLAETSVTTADNGGVGMSYDVPFVTLPSTGAKVTFNGVEYECVLRYFEAEGEVALGVGNGALLSALGTEAPDTGEPFAYVAMEMDGQQMAALITAEAGTYTIAMYGDIEKIVSVPAKYLPSPYVINYDDLPIEEPYSLEWSEIVRRVEEAVLHNQRVLLDFGGELLEGTARIFPESGYQVGQVIFLSTNGSNLRYDVINVNRESIHGGRFQTFEIEATQM